LITAYWYEILITFIFKDLMLKYNKYVIQNYFFFLPGIEELDLDQAVMKVFVYLIFSMVLVLLICVYLLEEADTDLETDRLLGQQRTDDTGFFDEKSVSFFK